MREIKKNTKYQILTPSGWSDFDGISRQLKNKTITIETKNNSITCTYDHLLDNVEAQDLKIGNITSLGPIINIIHNVKSEYVYDPLDVKLGNEYYSNEFISHNCTFIGSSNSLIEGWKLESLKNSVTSPIAIADGLKIYNIPVKEGTEWVDMFDEKTHSQGLTEKIMPAHKYVIVADVSRGKGLDYSALSVFDISSIPYKQVATFRDNEINPTDFALVLHQAALFYNSAAILPEINDIGEQVGALLIDEYSYDNVLCTSNRAGRAGKHICYNSIKADKGVRTTLPLKKSGCLLLKLLIEQHKLIIEDSNTIDELLTFVKDKTAYSADKGKHDDLVSTLWIFAWLTDQDYFKELTDLNTMMSLAFRNQETMENELLLWGYCSAPEIPKVLDPNPYFNLNVPWNPWDSTFTNNNNEQFPPVIENCKELLQ